MYLHKVIIVLAALLALSTAYNQPQVDDLQAEETNIAQTRQKRAPLLLKKLLIGGLLAKKALIVGGGAGLVGGGVAGALVHKWSQGGKKHPIYTGAPAPYPIYQEKPPVYYDPAPPAVRPPVYFNQYPSAPIVSNPSGHYGAAFYINKVHSKPLPPFPSVHADCYTSGTSSFNPSYNSASNGGYAR
ncbi:hypothetical protein PV327_006577 [Microctonus hyperodae]|uniref:Uncharacterized protein n=1 Tax=Microctonus hyperodae TaxID=165561 RepID=A0AA39KIF8_MICHY|nr:hypothetical protein PV327_006577 [Microctonus hyperodae]